MRRFIENVPETEFQAALEVCSEPKIEMLLAARLDPAYRTSSFASLCKKFNVSLSEVDDIWRNHQLHVGMMRMMSKVPDMMADMVEDARSSMVCCPRCDGLKRVSEGGDDGKKPIIRACPVCNETGLVRHVGDKVAREIVSEAAGLIGKKVPMFAVQNNNFGMDSALEELLMTSQKVLKLGTGGE
jgi:hypothetical protein